MLIFLGLAFAGCNRHDPPPANVAEIGTRMTALMKQHRFNEAAQLGVDASAGKPDAMTYYWVALAYAEKAHYEPDTKDESLKLVSEYARKSSALEPNSRVIGFIVPGIRQHAEWLNAKSAMRRFRRSGSKILMLCSRSSRTASMNLQTMTRRPLHTLASWKHVPGEELQKLPFGQLIPTYRSADEPFQAAVYQLTSPS